MTKITRLKVIRLIMRLIMATRNESRSIEKFFKHKEIYTYLEIPDRCFRSHKVQRGLVKW